jgi:peptidoglycan/LPS O-acetylase OafA/YrhL
LDAIRGLAALSIVFWHWVHFFRQDMLSFQRELQPLYAVFAPLYTKGWRAVDLFFCLSGFIFYWRYSRMVAEREISIRNFCILRLARLYPLHILTLVMVAVGQLYMMAQMGAYFVYPNNDLYHFVLQTVFAANWGMERGWSFNAPVWSVSYELVLYAVFWGICFCNLRRWWHLGLIICVSCALTFARNPHVHQLSVCAMGFFSGGLAFYAFTCLVRYSNKVVVPIVLTGVSIVTWIVAPQAPGHTVPVALFDGWVGVMVSQTGALLLKLWYSHSFSLIVFPLTIMTAALWETRCTSIARWTGFLGRISYSSYLLHFPLQLVFAGVASLLGVSCIFFYTPLALGLFFATLIPLSLASYHFFELPCKMYILERLFSKRCQLYAVRVKDSRSCL